MKRVLLALALGFVALLGRARAADAGSVGVVVTGEAALQPSLVEQIEGWLRSHGYTVAARSLDAPATNRVIDCFTLDDTSCARKVVEKSAQSDSVVFVRAAREGSAVSLSVYWILKGKPAVGSRRGCEECSDGALRGTADELLQGLAEAIGVASGRLKLTSDPAGLIVMLDGAKVGVTPLERDIAEGAHTITLVDGGTRVGERQVKIPAGATIEVTMKAEYPVDDPRRPLPPSKPSRVLPAVLFAGGGLMIAGGIVELYLGQQGGKAHPEDPYNYPYATPAGIALVSAGAVAIGVGVWQWRRISRESSPVAALSPHGAYLGWQGRF